MADEAKINGWTIIFADGSWQARYGEIVGTTGPATARKAVEKWAWNHNPEDVKRQRDK